MSNLRRSMMMAGRGGGVPLEVQVIDGAYIRESDGMRIIATGFFYTSTIPVRSGQVVVFNGYTGAAGAAIYTGTGEPYTSRAKGRGSSSYLTYTWVATEDADVGFCAKRGTNAPVATIDGENVTFIGY